MKELLRCSLILVCLAVMVIGFGICIEAWTIYPAAAFFGTAGLVGAAMGDRA